MSGGTPAHQFDRLFMVGIKGTGMTALAELLQRRGVAISGSDSEERFYTDAILADLGIRVLESFDAALVPSDVDTVIYSAAYNPQSHPQLLRAAELGKPLLSYTEALGALSATQFSVGVAGVHGKTTTTAMIGTLVRELGLPGSVLVGSAVADFDGRSTYSGGDEFLVAETCEYKRHFLAFHPDLLVVTGIEPDHLDYFADLNDIKNAFFEYVSLLPPGGTLIYCADDAGAVDICVRTRLLRPDLALIGYGRAAGAEYRVGNIEQLAGETRFSIGGWDEPIVLHLPGAHNALNAAAAVAAVDALAQRFEPPPAPPAETAAALPAGTEEVLPGEIAGRPPAVDPRLAIGRALAAFRGTRRRSEILGEAAGVLFLDDYGHHPTAIRTTLAGLRAFYPDRRLVVDFMSHTYSRTARLLDDFAESFSDADTIVLHEIYASAREQFDGTITGADLAERTGRHHPRVHYYERVMDAFEPLLRMLRAGDLFVTMGAGNNWQLGERLLAALRREQSA